MWIIRRKIICAALFATLLVSALPLRAAEGQVAPIAEPQGNTHYTADVAKLAAMPAPAPDGILMVGSSIFRKWQSCATDLAPLPVTNRAFGGSKTADQLFFFDQIVPTSKAALVIWYCGSNDTNAKITPEAILQNTKEWITRTHTALPKARILLVSSIRAPQKRSAGLLPQVDALNKGLQQLPAADPLVTYIDVNPSLESADGEPVVDCYVSDHLHLTAEGYRRMAAALHPTIDKIWQAPTIQR